MPPNEVCRYFANGICSKGSICKFKHDEAARNEYVCQFFLAGKCSFGHTCRFKHERPKIDTPSSSSSTFAPGASTSSSSSHRVRPVRLEKPGLNTAAEEFVPSWLKKEKEEPEKPKEIRMKGMGYTYATAAGSSISKEKLTTMSLDVASRMMCPYHQQNGDCNRKDGDCPFAHGEICDMCNQWALHPDDEELRERHKESCLQRHQEEMERAFFLQESAKKTCGICMECIVEKNLRFGILNNCRHCFCLNCIRVWRQRDLTDANINTKTVRSCPECRQHSDYVIPSLFWVEQGKEKETLIEMYRDNMKSKVCKYYSSTDKDRGTCKFGNQCFYKHQRPDGTIDKGQYPRTRRQPRLCEFIYPREYFVYSSESELDDDELFENFNVFQRYVERDAEMLAYADEVEDTDTFHEEFYQAIRNMVREIGREGPSEERAGPSGEGPGPSGAPGAPNDVESEESTTES